MVSLGNHWKRFISACTTPSANATIGSGSVTSSAGIVSNAGSAAAAGAGGTPSTQNSLQKSPVEWQCLNETVNTLLKGCPVSRLAILDHLAPLYVEYFVTWWQINSTSSSNRPQETGNATVRNLSYESQNLNKAEVVLRDLLKTIHELIIQDGTSDHFFAAVCSWCLVLIRPVCTAAPTQLLSNLMDLLRSPNRHSDNAKLSSTSARNIHGTRLTDRVALEKSKLKNALNTDNSAATTSDNKSNNNKGVNYQRTGKHKSDHQLIIVSDSDSSSNSTSDEDNEEDVDEGEVASEDIQMASDSIHNTGNNETGESKPSFTNLDNRDQTTDIKSSSNKRNGQIRFGVGKLDSSSGLPIKGDSVSDHTVNLDLSPTSAVNQQILGLWVKCPVVVDLLNITCDCLLGSNIRLSSVQALLACSTVPIWDTSLDNPKNCYSLANSVLPHWIIIWLLYQATREINLLSTGIQKLNQLFDLILTSALHPFEPNVLQSTLIPDTLGGYSSQWDFDSNFWITVCLTHILFLGDSVPEFLGNWLRIKLDPIFSYAVLISNETSLEIDSTDKQGSVSQPMKLINLLLSLSLISVPIPPQFPLEQQKSSTSSHPTCDMSMDRPLRYPHPPSKGFNYGAPVPFRPPCGSNERECAPMLPRFNMPMPPRNMNPMLPTPCHMTLPSNNINMMMNSGPPTGQPNFMPFRSNFPRQFEAPIRRPPLLQVPLNNVQPIRPSVNDSYPPITTVGVLLFSERQSNNTCLPTGRQPTSLVWILSLVRRIKVVTMSIVIDKFVSLTPHQLFILLRNQHDLNQQTALSLFHLLVKAILQAPVGSNTERLLAYLMDICETELPRSDHTPTVTSIVCTSTASVITNAEGTYCSDAKKPKLNSDDLQQHNRQQNQPLPHRQQQSKLEYDDFLNSFLLYCREILRVLCETAICLIYSSSETSDLLDHGGCEGFLRAIQQLASRPPPLTLYSTTNVALDRNTSAMSNDKVDLKWMLLSNSKSCLFEKLISSNALQSSSCAQLILSLGMTLEPSLLEHLLFYLCCWKSQTKKINSDTSSFTSPESTRLTASDSPSQQFTYCPLILFFPILSEIQSIWIARTSCKPPSLTATSATSSATVTAGGSTIMPTSITFIHSSIFPVMSVRSKYLSMNSHRNDTSNYNNYSGSGSNNNNTSLSLISPNGLLYIQQLLANKFFPLLWSNIENSNVELRTSLLRNLLWLVYKEYALIEKNTAHPRILFALAAQLDEIVAMMLKTFDTECLDLLLSLCECIFCSFQFSSSIDDSLNSTNNTDNNACSSSVKLSGPSQHPHPPGRFHQGHQNSGLWKTNIPLLGRHYQTLAFLHLSPAQCMKLAHRFVQLTSQLFEMMNVELNNPKGSTSSPCRYFYLFGRLRDLLNMLCSSDQLSVFRSTFIRFIPKVMMSGRTHPCMDDLFKNSSAVTDNLNLFTPNISCLPSSFFTNSCPVGKNNTIISSKLVSDSLASSSTFLLLNNPPKKIGQTLDDGLIRGQLKPRISNNITNNNEVNGCGHLKQLKSTRMSIHRGPGEGSLGLGYHYTENHMKNEKFDEIDWQPIWLHWLNLIRFITMNEKQLYNLCNLESLEASTHLQDNNNSSIHLNVDNHQLISGLEDIVMQNSGIHLPQTSITNLPFPSLNLVLPPSGVGLERVLNLLYWFCPEAKQLMSSGSNRLNNSRRAIVQFSAQGIFELSIVLEKIRLKNCGLPPLYHPLPRYALHFTESSSVLNFLDPLPLLSTPKLLLGLLMGLEAVWASPLAPRISIPKAINFLTKLDDGAYVEQAFPVLGASEVCKAHARKIAVDYAYRRVDTNSAVFQFTCNLLLSLMEVCCTQDCIEKQQQRERHKSIKSESLPTELPFKEYNLKYSTLQPAPLDRLLHCLTPRELAILLSDIRRNLRLRMGFYYIKQRKAIETIYPENNGNDNNSGGDQLPLVMMLNPLPPTPAFITPGLIVALIQAHLMEEDIAGCLGELLQSMEVLTQYTNNQQADGSSCTSVGGRRRGASSIGKSTVGNKHLSSDSMETGDNVGDDKDEDEDTIVEEISVNGEQYIVIK